MTADPDPRETIRIAEVLAITGLRRTMLFEHIKNGGFPCQVQLGARAVGWYRWQVVDWTRNRPLKQSRMKVVSKGAKKEEESKPWRLEQGSRTDSAYERRESKDPAASVFQRSTTQEPNVISALSHRGADQTADEADHPSPLKKPPFNAVKTKSPSTASGETDETERLRAENSRLKVLLANLVLQNDALQSEIRFNGGVIAIQ